jgi:lysozyme
MNHQIIKQLRFDEGEVLHAYDDHLGFATIGVGRLIDKRKGGGISPDESAYLLNNDIASRDQILRSKYPWFAQMNEPRQAALINMAFQLGLAGLAGFPKMLAALRDERYAEAETHALDSLWAKQTPARAKRVARQLKTGAWEY